MSVIASTLRWAGIREIHGLKPLAFFCEKPFLVQRFILIVCNNHVQ